MSLPSHSQQGILAHDSDPYEERDYRKSAARVRQNPLLVKVQTGKSKATTYNLPAEGFTYGRRDHCEEEGVKEVVNSWQHHRPASAAVPGRDFMGLNRSAVKEGAVTSKDFAAYRTTHDARLKSVTVVTKAPAPRVDPALTYGKPSPPSESIAEVIQNQFQRDAIAEARRRQEEADARRAAAEGNKAGKFGGSQHTRASLGHMKVRPPPAKEPFKMDKFKQVGPRIGHQGLSTLAASPENQQRQMERAKTTTGVRTQQQSAHTQQQDASSSPQQYEQQSPHPYGSSRTFEEEKTQEVLRY